MADKFNRSKFKGTKLSALNKSNEEAEKNSKNPLSVDNKYLKYHKVEEGRNEFRIMPPIKEGELAYYPKRVSWLEVGVPDKDDENKVEIKSRPIFIATIHGNEKLKELGKDPIELYIEYIKELAGDIDDKEERKEFLDPVIGGFYSEYKGIIPQTVYASYAIKNNTLANFELYDSYMKEMNKIISTIEDEEGEIEFDIFSDPDEGYPLIIKKEKNEDEKTKKNKKWITTITEGKQKRTESFEEFCERNMVTDAQLQELSKQQSLKERFVDCYTMRDFDLAIDGLRRFDERFNFKIFENEDFLTQIDKIQKIVPEPKKTTKNNEDIDDAFDLVKEVKKYSKIKLRKFLQNYVSVNYEELEDEYNAVLKTLSPEVLLEWAILAAKKEDLPELEEENDVEVSDDVESEEEDVDNTETEEELPTRRRRRS